VYSVQASIFRLCLWAAADCLPLLQDRPLLAQFCANDPDTLLAAARLVAPFVDGVDLNLGCPQRIARRGNYGAMLATHQVEC
jgi:tRNA-dihydrouridine synthase